jgi:hypothetical protein
MALTGHGSNRRLKDHLDQLGERLDALRGARANRTPPRREALQPSRRRWNSITEAVATVLGPAGELRARDVHAAVEALLGEPVSRSSVKNCLSRHSAGQDPRFERLAQGHYRLA